MQLQNAFEHIMSFGIAFIALTGFAGPSELEGRGILADTLILFSPRGAGYTHHITTRTTPPLQIFRPSYGPALWYKAI